MALRGQAVRKAKGLPQRVQESTRVLVADLLRDGYGRNAVARMTNLGLATVTRIGRDAGLTVSDLEHANRERTERVIERAREHHVNRRLQVYNLIADRLTELLAAEDLTPPQLRDLAVVTGILTQNYRLDTDQATSRPEVAVTHVYLPEPLPIPTFDAFLSDVQRPWLLAPSGDGVDGRTTAGDAADVPTDELRTHAHARDGAGAGVAPRSGLDTASRQGGWGVAGGEGVSTPPTFSMRKVDENEDATEARHGQSASVVASPTFSPDKGRTVPEGEQAGSPTFSAHKEDEAAALSTFASDKGAGDAE
jgi:hypothetical protein